MKTHKIYLTGDLHGYLGMKKLINFAKTEGKNLTKEDYLIILGDFGLIFNAPVQSPDEAYNLEWLDKKAPWTTLFLDGNHENFDRLDNYVIYPLQTFHGGQVSKINNSVYHLLRGESYSINDILFLVIGGAGSIDKARRTRHISWWPQEEISHEQIKNVLKFYRNVSFDYILTHSAPTSYVDDLYLKNLLYPGPRYSDRSEKRLEKVKKNIGYKKWFCGHYHCEYDSPKFQVLYDSIIELPSPDSFY